jgi:hypothetical protein
VAVRVTEGATIHHVVLQCVADDDQLFGVAIAI